MSVRNPDYAWRREAGRTYMSGQTSTVLVTGNTTDLFWVKPELTDETVYPNGNYVGLLDYLKAEWAVPEGGILIVYEVNSNIEIPHKGDALKVQQAWVTARAPEILTDINLQADHDADRERISLRDAQQMARKEWMEHQMFLQGKSTAALRVLSKLCKISRDSKPGDTLYGKRLIILIEDADLLLPHQEVSQLSDTDRRRAVLCRDWFTDMDFQRSSDAVVLIAESASQINERVRSIPQMQRVVVPPASLDERRHFIMWFNSTQPEDRKIQLWGSQTDLAEMSAGLSLHALWKLLRGTIYDGLRLTLKDVTKQVEEYILSQLGEETVEFHRPHHGMDALIGNKQLIAFLRDKVKPRLVGNGEGTLRGFGVSGPIRAGKTFIMEGFVSELGMPVLILKNLRSKWFGETDVIIERLYRVLQSLGKVALFVDEADTVFGGVGKDEHSTERRLTGKIQNMMSDPRLKGRVIWILMTARIHLLSADVRGPGRVGNLILPVLDPAGDEREEWIRWTIKKYIDEVPEPGTDAWKRLDEATKGYAAGYFASLREELAAEAAGGRLTLDEVLELVDELMIADIAIEREMQMLYAMVNCTRKSLIPGGDTMTRAEVEAKKLEWLKQAKVLEAQLAD